MHSIVLTLDPGKLENPDLDLRYELPKLLEQQSVGGIREEGYDYEEREGQDPLLAIFLSTNNLHSATVTISQLIRTQRILGSDLSPAAALYVETEGKRFAVNIQECVLISNPIGPRQ